MVKISHSKNLVLVRVELIICYCPVLRVWKLFFAIFHQLAVWSTLTASGKCSAPDVQSIENFFIIIFEYQLSDYGLFSSCLCFKHFSGVSSIFVADSYCFCTRKRLLLCADKTQTIRVLLLTLQKHPRLIISQKGLLTLLGDKIFVQLFVSSPLLLVLLRLDLLLLYYRLRLGNLSPQIRYCLLQGYLVLINLVNFYFTVFEFGDSCAI